MASNQLSDQVRNDILKDLDSIFGRAVHFLEFPLADPEDQRKLVLARINDQAVLDSLDAICVSDWSDFLLNSRRMNTVRVEGWPQIHLVSAVPLHGIPADGDSISVERVNQRLGAKKAMALLGWLEQATVLDKEIEAATETVDDILKMVRTAGQLKRMVPELIKHLRPEHQKLLAKQSRTSAVPYEWSAYPRVAVENATNTVAKCLLLPYTTLTWKERFEQTWIGNH